MTVFHLNMCNSRTCHKTLTRKWRGEEPARLMAVCPRSQPTVHSCSFVRTNPFFDMLFVFVRMWGFAPFCFLCGLVPENTRGGARSTTGPWQGQRCWQSWACLWTSHWQTVFPATFQTLDAFHAVRRQCCSPDLPIVPCSSERPYGWCSCFITNSFSVWRLS